MPPVIARPDDQVWRMLLGDFTQPKKKNEKGYVIMKKIVVIGGGTMGGLCRKLVGMERFGQIRELARQGDLNKVDLTIKDISQNPAATLDPDLTAANFGNLAEDATPADLAAGVVNLVLQAVGIMTVLACQACNTDTVILTGAMTTMPQAVENFQNFQRLFGYQYVIPENATFATAIGAALCSLRDMPDNNP